MTHAGASTYASLLLSGVTNWALSTALIAVATVSDLIMPALKRFEIRRALVGAEQRHAMVGRLRRNFLRLLGKKRCSSY